MNLSMVRDMILFDGIELCGQPKWTFGKNTCNTFELFVERIHLPDGEKIPAWLVMDMLQRDEALSRLFTGRYLEASLRSGADLTEQADANVTLSFNLLPVFCNEDDFAQTVLCLLDETGFTPRKLQFELNDAQQLTKRGIQNLNLLHDEHGIGLWLANFGAGQSNIDLLGDVHFDGVELDASYTQAVPQHKQTCRLVVAIQHMAHTLDLQVCVKGIETQDQFEFFEELGCYKGQGRLIGPAMNMERMLEYIRNYAVHRGHA